MLLNEYFSSINTLLVNKRYQDLTQVMRWHLCLTPPMLLFNDSSHKIWHIQQTLQHHPKPFQVLILFRSVFAVIYFKSVGYMLRKNAVSEKQCHLTPRVMCLHLTRRTFVDLQCDVLASGQYSGWTHDSEFDIDFHRSKRNSSSKFSRNIPSLYS